VASRDRRTSASYRALIGHWELSSFLARGMHRSILCDRFGPDRLELQPRNNDRLELRIGGNLLKGRQWLLAQFRPSNRNARTSIAHPTVAGLRARVADEGLPIIAAPLIRARKFLRLDRCRIEATRIASRRRSDAIRLLGSEIIFAAARAVGAGRGHIPRCNHRTVSTSETNSMGDFERTELRQVASFMGLGSGARGVAGELHLQGGEHGLGAGGRADLNRHRDEVEPAG
jgi:hypothetical protein